MKGILCISHGYYAREFVESVKMIAGPVTNLYSCCLDYDDGPETFTVKIENVLKDMTQYEEIIVFADLFGGSPCNTALAYFFNDDHVQLIAGMNFQMVLSAVLDEENPETLIDHGKKAIVDVKAFVKANQDLDD